MYINNVTKKIFALIALVLHFFCLTTIFIACAPPTPDRIYGVGDVWESEAFGIKFDSADYEKTGDIIEVKLRFIINPTTEWSIKEQDVYLFVVADKPIYAIKDKSIELSNFNVFEKTITNESIYVFVFQVPISLFKNEERVQNEMSWGIGVYVNHATFHFELSF